MWQMKLLIFVFLSIFGISDGYIAGGGGCGGFGAPPPPPPPPLPLPSGPCGQRPPFFPPPIASPCQPRPFFPPPPQPLPQHQYPNYGYPCQIPYGPQFQPHQGPSSQLPPLFQPPRVYPEIPPEEYLRLINEQKLIKETLIKKNLPDPFEDGKKTIPFIPEKYYPEPRPIPIPSEMHSSPGGGGGGGGIGCGGYFGEQSYQQFRPYPPYGPYYRPPYPTGPYPSGPYPAQPLPHSHAHAHLPPPGLLQNCCTRCGCGSKAFGQKIANSTAEESASSAAEINDNSKKELQCNNEKLKKIMEKTYLLPLKSAKSIIHESAESSLGHSFQVICSQYDFDYIVRSSLFCQVELKNGICYAFKTS